MFWCVLVCAWVPRLQNRGLQVRFLPGLFRKRAHANEIEIEGGGLFELSRNLPVLSHRQPRDRPAYEIDILPPKMQCRERSWPLIAGSMMRTTLGPSIRGRPFCLEFS